MVSTAGAVSGLIVGALVGWLLVLFGAMTPEISALWLTVNAGILGAVLGATVTLLGYLLTRGHRWFTYPPDVRARQHEVLVDAMSLTTRWGSCTRRLRHACRTTFRPATPTA